jgi:hypothetical protein
VVAVFRYVDGEVRLEGCTADQRVREIESEAEPLAGAAEH